MARNQKKARRLKAWLVFLDESAFLMAPLVRRGWSVTGRPPIVVQRTRSHRKVSAIAALAVTPGRDRVHLYFRLHADANVTAPLVVRFLRVLLDELPGPVILLWDRLGAHRSRPVASFLIANPRLHVHLLPAYAPELNPIENVWGYLKTNPLANWAPLDLDELVGGTRHHGRCLQHRPALLRSLIRHTPLSLRLK